MLKGRGRFVSFIIFLTLHLCIEKPFTIWILGFINVLWNYKYVLSSKICIELLKRARKIKWWSKSSNVVVCPSRSWGFLLLVVLHYNVHIALNFVGGFTNKNFGNRIFTAEILVYWIQQYTIHITPIHGDTILFRGEVKKWNFWKILFRRQHDSKFQYCGIF